MSQEKKDFIKIMIALALLGMFFRWLYTFFDAGPSGNLFWLLADGGMSGLCVGVGIILTLKWKLIGKLKWGQRIVPYACGGLGVLISKLVKMILWPKEVRR